VQIRQEKGSRESNPRPQILCLRPYMLSLVFDLTFRNPTGRTANGGSGEF